MADGGGGDGRRETLIASALDLLADGIAVFDDGLSLVTANEGFRRLFGGPAKGGDFAEILKDGYRRLGLGDDDARAEAGAALERARARAGHHFERELAGGSVISARFEPLDEGGILVRCRDITESRREEKSAKERELRYALVAQAATEGLYDWNVADDELVVSERLNEIFQFAEGELQSSEWYRRIHPEDAPDYRTALRAHFRGQTPKLESEYRILDGKSRYRWVLDHAIGVRDEGGRVVRMVGAVSDIAELKRREAAMVLAVGEKDSVLEEFNVVLDTIEYAILFLGPDGRARLINRGFLGMWGIPDVFLARRPTFTDLINYNRYFGVYDVPDAEWEAYVEGRVRAIESGDIAPTELALADGRTIQFQCKALADGGRMLTYFDITDLKSREKDLLAARNRAEETLAELRRVQDSLLHAEKMASLGQLTAGIAHEIKNPLNFINNFADTSVEMLDELAAAIGKHIESAPADERAAIDDLVETLKSDMGTIAKHGRRADGIVRSMLMHARDETGSLAAADINALIQSSLDLAYHGERARNPGFNITVERDLDPAAGTVEVHTQELSRALINLFNNSFYATDQRAKANGEGYRPLLTVRSGGDERSVRVHVRDNGTGMPPAVREKLFSPFFTTKPAGEGTGLGLSLSYDIVVQGHGGAIDVESEEGAFTEFIVTLPRTPRAAARDGS